MPHAVARVAAAALLGLGPCVATAGPQVDAAGAPAPLMPHNLCAACHGGGTPVAGSPQRPVAGAPPARRPPRPAAPPPRVRTGRSSRDLLSTADHRTP